MTTKRVPVYDEFSWQSPVKDKDLTAAPGSPAKGDRYLIISAVSGEQIDQQQTQINDNYIIYGNNIHGQTFKAGLLGDLTKVILNLKKVGTPNNLIIEIRNVVNQLPGSTIYASEEIEVGSIGTDYADITIIFSSPYTVTPGIDYAIVFYQKTYGGDVENQYDYRFYTNYSVYENGAFVYKTGSDPWAKIDDYDLFFKIYVNNQAWTDKSGYLTIFNGTSWDFMSPLEGMICWVEDEDLYYKYNGSVWDILDKANVGLGNVLNVEQENVANKDTDGTLAANSDTKYPSQKATKTYADTKASYSEGTWTPSVGGNATYNAANFGKYVKIGKMVIVQGLISINVIGTGSTSLLSGLPFAASVTGIQSGAVSYFGTLAVNTIYLGCYVNNGAATIYFVGKATSGLTCDNAIALFGNGTAISFSAVYFTD